MFMDLLGITLDLVIDFIITGLTPDGKNISK